MINRNGFRNASQRTLRDFVRANYPDSAVVVVFGVSGEYNDQGYDNSITSATVRDRDGAEVLPATDLDSRSADEALIGLAPDLPGDGDYDSDLSGDFVVLIGK